MQSAGPAAYDEVAALYDSAFSDIRVRRVAWRWLKAQLARSPRAPRVLELGCGTGAVLRALAPHVAEGVGVDVSAAMLQRARAQARGAGRLSFVQLADHRLPFERGRFDVVLSFLSFRYLDWERSWQEVQRVLAPGGRFLLVDLVAERIALHEAALLLRSSLRHLVAPLRAPRFQLELAALTSHPAWHAMLRRHPMRALSEYRGFFQRQLGVVRFETLDLTPTRRVVALAASVGG